MNDPYVRRCPDCSTGNRAFARYCRGCGIALPRPGGSWLGYKGGARRLGVNPAALPADCVTRATGLRLRLGDACRSLLGHDRHLVAVSASGTVEVADPLHGKSVSRFQVQGPVTTEPCIEDGVLYIGARGQLSAYSLAALTMETPRVRPLWTVPLSGTPIHALTPVGERLYVTVASTEGREVQVVERQSVRTVIAAPRTSWIAAGESDGRAVFLSEHEGSVRLHVAGDAVVTHPVALSGFGEQPVSLLGSTLFGVFGDNQRLYRIDVETGQVAEPLGEDTQFFALTREGDEWDRQLVSIDSKGIRFSGTAVRDSFAPHERATKGSPVIVQGCSVAVGMEDGRVLLYNLAELPRHDVWRLEGGAPITSLASFESFVVAGNRDGVVEARELVAKGAAR